MLIRKLSAIATLCGFCTFSSPVMADENADIKEMFLKQQKQIEALSNTVKSQQKQIEQQQTVHNEALTHYIKNEVDRALQDKSTSLITLGSNVENLKFTGDLRVRYENRDNSGNNSRDRFRQRFRLGFLWQTNEGWEVGAGLITGEGNEDSHSGSSGATSGNDTYSDDSPFESGDIFLDYAYAKHKWENGMSITLGQHKNPFTSSSILWDADVRFVGATAAGHYDSGIFWTGGAYVVQTAQSDNGNNDDSNLFALQGGYAGEHTTAALAYYHFDHDTSRDILTSGDSQAEIISAYVDFKGKTESFSYKVFGEYSVNIGADNNGISQVGAGVDDPEENNQAYILGAEVGIGKFKAKYAYAHFGSDAAFGPLTDADFGTAVSGTNNSNNTEGHIFGLDYKVTKSFAIGTKLIVAEAIEGDEENGELFQLDFKYKF